MIDHVTANVSDVEAAKSFYGQALAPLGYSLQMEFPGAAGFGTGEGIPDFWLGSSEGRGAAHVAFQAPDRATVDRFYEAALAAGGKDNGAPGLRPYHETYYAAYVPTPTGTTWRRSATNRSENRRGLIRSRFTRPRENSYNQPLRTSARWSILRPGQEPTRRC